MLKCPTGEVIGLYPGTEADRPLDDFLFVLLADTILANSAVVGGNFWTIVVSLAVISYQLHKR